MGLRALCQRATWFMTCTCNCGPTAYRLGSAASDLTTGINGSAGQGV